MRYKLVTDEQFDTLQNAIHKHMQGLYGEDYAEQWATKENCLQNMQTGEYAMLIPNEYEIENTIQIAYGDTNYYDEIEEFSEPESFEIEI